MVSLYLSNTEQPTNAYNLLSDLKLRNYKNFESAK